MRSVCFVSPIGAIGCSTALQQQRVGAAICVSFHVLYTTIPCRELFNLHLSVSLAVSHFPSPGDMPWLIQTHPHHVLGNTCPVLSTLTSLPSGFKHQTERGGNTTNERFTADLGFIRREMRRPGRPRPAPGGFLIALATARKSFTRAFCFGGGSSSSVGKRLFRSTAAESSAKAGTGPRGLATATPPESPFPPAGDDGELESFFLLRHGQTNFNAIGRIQVRVVCLFLWASVVSSGAALYYSASVV